ncbi:hypothetical protein PPBDW_I10153 [Photobacterium kishitanii]|nr:hypothetical protein PPBDW_I10153 [Photobacterium kishitanii]
MKKTLLAYHIVEIYEGGELSIVFFDDKPRKLIFFSIDN